MRNKFKPKPGRLVPNYTVIFVVITLLGLFACVFVVRVLELTVAFQENLFQAAVVSDISTLTPEFTPEASLAITPDSPLAGPTKRGTPLPTPIPITVCF